MFGRDMVESGIAKGEFRKDFEVKHRIKGGGEDRSAGKRSHLAAKSWVRVINWSRRKDRIFIKWSSCSIKDYVDVPRASYAGGTDT